MSIDPKKIEPLRRLAAKVTPLIHEETVEARIGLHSLLSDREEMLALLREVEWGGAPYRPGEPEAEAFRSTCPTCGGVRGPWPNRSPIADIEWHVPGCRLAAFLKET